MKSALIIGAFLLLAACTTVTDTDTVPEGCDPAFAGADACTAQYDPVCATFENGTQSTIGNACTACAQTEGVVSIAPGACEGEEPLPGEEPREQLGAAQFTACEEPRPEFCTREFMPVCGMLDNGTAVTYGNGCTACSFPEVTGHYPGECADVRFVLCDEEETVTGFSPAEFAEQTGGACVDACPGNFDPYVTQTGVSLCIMHYGEDDIEDWPVCTRSSETCECVLTTETTSGEQIEDAEYRCVPEQYASRLLFRSGQDRLDEDGERSVLIA